ncbi:MAG: AzlD domain-containing protein [Pseudomonadota bacterium]
MTFSAAEIWILIVAIGVGTYAIRFSFLGLMGNRSYPDWALRMLRYTPVAVLPGLVAPLVVWPAATEGQVDPARLIAAAATLGVGIWTKNTMWAIAAGAVTFYGLGAALA